MIEQILPALRRTGVDLRRSDIVIQLGERGLPHAAALDHRRSVWFAGGC